MATTFSSLYQRVRDLLGDTDPLVRQYPDSVLRSQMELAVVTAEVIGVDVEDDLNPESFSEVLTAKQRALAVFLTLRSILSYVPNEFAYAGPVMTIRRKGNATSMLNFVQSMLDRLNGDTCPISQETEYEHFMNSAARHADLLANATE
jgi:hypothetical protein